MKASEIVTRFVGQCQVCEGDFKIHSERVVLHGYRRPGEGYLVGECWGQGHKPYELSCDLLPKWLAHIRARAAGARTFLAKLKKADHFTGEQRTGQYLHGNPVMEPIEMVRASSASAARATEGGEWTKFKLLSEYEWEHAQGSRVRQVEREIAYYDREADRVDERIRTWELRPLREVDELGRTAEVKAAQKARSDARAETRRERDAKAEMLFKKKLDAAARREAMLGEAGKLIRAAAASGDVEAGRAEAMRVLRELGKKKWRSTLDPNCMEWCRASQLRDGKVVTFDVRRPSSRIDPRLLKSMHWETDLGADEALLALGLAEARDGDRMIQYRSNLWQAY